MKKRTTAGQTDSMPWRRASVGRNGLRSLAIATWARRRYSRCSTARPRAARYPACDWQPLTRKVPSTWPRRSPRNSRIGPTHGGLAGRDRAQAPALSWPRSIRPDRQRLPGRASTSRFGSEEPIQEFFADCDAVFALSRPREPRPNQPNADGGSRKSRTYWNATSIGPKT